MGLRLVAGPDRAARLVRARLRARGLRARPTARPGIATLARLYGAGRSSRASSTTPSWPSPGPTSASPASTRRSAGRRATTGRWATIEAEYRRTVALARARDRPRPAARRRARAAAPIALRDPYVDSLSELQVTLLARLRACRPDDPERGAAPAARPADGQRHRRRAPAHRLGALDHGPRTLPPGRPAVGFCGRRHVARRTWADIGAGRGAFTLALADLLGRRPDHRHRPGRRCAARERAGGACPVPAVATRPRWSPTSKDSSLACPSMAWSPPTASITCRGTGRSDVVRALAAICGPAAPFIVVEYDADRGNPGVPHPFSYPSWEPRSRPRASSETHRATTRPGGGAHLPHLGNRQGLHHARACRGADE